MNNILKFSIGLMVGVSMLACSDDDVLVGTPQVVPAKVFLEDDISLQESAASVVVPISFDKPAVADGEITISINGLYEGALTTSPEIIGSVIKVSVTKGDTEAGFTVYPIDNDIVNEAVNVDVKISDVSSGFQVGSVKVLKLSILDDMEDVVDPVDPTDPTDPTDPVVVLGLPKSYETFTGQWRYKKTYEYDAEGRVSKVRWESETPMYKSGVETYYYGANNLIERINYQDNMDVYFYQEEGRIVKSERIEFGVKKSYSLYDYDVAGNPGIMVTYHRQSNGSYAQGLMHLYLFWNTGNIYKHMIYTKDVSSDEDILLSTRTYDNYIDKGNHFPMIEVIPGINMQPKLPTTYRLEEHGHDFLYTISYELNSQGYITQRSVSSSNGGGEGTKYEWY
jgi:hypothetical protein